MDRKIQKALSDIRILAPDILRIREAVKEIWTHIDEREKWFENVVNAWKQEEEDWLTEKARLEDKQNKLKERIYELEHRLYGDRAHRPKT